jgi:hypothetical protein
MWCWSIARIEVTTRAPERDVLVDRTDRGDSPPNLYAASFRRVTGTLETIVARNAAVSCGRADAAMLFPSLGGLARRGSFAWTLQKW